MQGAAMSKGKAVSRNKRRDDVFKRKKRSMQVMYTEEEISEIFRPFPEDIPPLKLLPSPETFLRQMQTTFQREFPGYISSPALLLAITTPDLAT